MKKILITGVNSYIGNSVDHWLSKYPDMYETDKISLKYDAWRQLDFSKYDVIFHVAGIAHNSSNSKMESLYYEVNRDLTIEIAKKARSEGVKQFVFMSSIIVYGTKNEVITIDTKPDPHNFYGDSKLQAEEGINKLETETFKIVIIRPPMVYGPGSKGNYLRLSKLAKIIPIFPNFSNKRSMIHINNLSELIKLIIEFDNEGIFTPQNKEYVNTSNLVQTIAKIHGKKVYLIKLFNPFIELLMRIDLVQKVFGDLRYDKSFSIYNNLDYQIVNFEDSIKLTETGED